MGLSVHADISLPDGDLADGDVIWSGDPIDAQHAAEVHIAGTIEDFQVGPYGASLFLGLAAESDTEAPGDTLFLYGLGSLEIPSVGLLWGHSGDDVPIYSFPFTFDIKLTPWAVSGGLAMLSVNGGDYGPSVEYFGDRTNARLFALFYGEESSVTLRGVTASVIPAPGSLLLCAVGVAFAAAAKRIRRRE